MDVDTNTAASAPPPAPSPTAASAAAAAAAGIVERSIKIHPLAIIGISDHHTRVITGGSALPPSSTVVGLLFGYYSSDSNGGGSGGRDVSIVDAEEMEYPKTTTNDGDDDDSQQQQGGRAAILKKIELHQKVFPQHKVVGWYRVQNGQQQQHDDENTIMSDNTTTTGVIMPSEEDLRMNQTEMTRYCNGGNGGNTGENGENDDGKKDNTANNTGEEENNGETPLFVLMNAAKTNDHGGGDNNNKKPSSSSNTTNGACSAEEMECDEELPLTVYETLATTDGGGAVFVNVDFELETYEPERIAVEKVFKTQPSSKISAAMALTSISSKDGATAASSSSGKEDDGGSNSPRKTGKKSKKDESSEQQQQQQRQQQGHRQASSSSKPSFTRGPSELDTQLDSLQSSIRAMNIRMNVLLEFLQRVECGEITPEDSLLRSVDGLVRQMPLVLAALEEGQTSSISGRKPLRELENEHGNTMLLTYLAAVAKTAKSVHVYSEKFRTACESGKSDPRRPLY